MTRLIFNQPGLFSHFVVVIRQAAILNFCSCFNF